VNVTLLGGRISAGSRFRIFAVEAAVLSKKKNGKAREKWVWSREGRHQVLTCTTLWRRCI